MIDSFANTDIPLWQTALERDLWLQPESTFVIFNVILTSAGYLLQRLPILKWTVILEALLKFIMNCFRNKG